MRDGVDKAVMLLVPANFPDQKNGVQGQAGDNHQKKDDAENQQGYLPPMKNYPADVQGHGQHDQANAQHGKKNDGFFSVTS